MGNLSELKINPYVTDKGGVVILNGPFPMKKAFEIARLCRAAPKLLNACQKIYASWHNFQCPICGADDEECKPGCAWQEMVNTIAEAEDKMTDNYRQEKVVRHTNGGKSKV